LRQRLANGAMSLPEALHTFVPLASALDHAHDHGIFHRDLKPANVILCADGPRLVLRDRRSRTRARASGEVQMGTLAYLPPEVFRGGRGGPAAMDVYAFGLLLYEALTGSRGFAGRPGVAAEEAAQHIAERKRWQGPFDPGDRFPHRLREVVRSATHPDPVWRPPMRAVRASLESLQERRASLGVAVAREGRSHSPLPVGAPADATIYVPDPEPRAKGAEVRPRSSGSGPLPWPRTTRLSAFFHASTVAPASSIATPALNVTLNGGLPGASMSISRNSSSTRPSGAAPRVRAGPRRGWRTPPRRTARMVSDGGAPAQEGRQRRQHAVSTGWPNRSLTDLEVVEVDHHQAHARRVTGLERMQAWARSMSAVCIAQPREAIAVEEGLEQPGAPGGKPPRRGAPGTTGLVK
jgi:serine/threonine protein kinase